MGWGLEVHMSRLWYFQCEWRALIFLGHEHMTASSNLGKTDGCFPQLSAVWREKCVDRQLSLLQEPNFSPPLS